MEQELRGDYLAPQFKLMEKNFKLDFGGGFEMLVLCSNGLSSENLLKAMDKRIKNCNTAVVVVTADNEYKEENYHVNRVVGELESLNLYVDILDLDKIPAKNLLKYEFPWFKRFKRNKAYGCRSFTTL